MSNNLPCGHPGHEDQRLSFPVGAIIETVSPVAHLGIAIPVGAKGRITSHCDDGRVWILFDDYNDAGHAFHAPEHFIRVVELPGSEPPAPRAGERDARQWHVSSESRSENGDATISAGIEWIGQVKRKHAAQIATEHNQHATLIEQRVRLVEFVRPFAKKGCVCMGETCAQRRLKKFCTPCRAAELLATIEQEGV